MPKVASANDTGARLIRALIKSEGTSIGDTKPGERLLRQARNLFRDGVPELLEAVAQGAVSVADGEAVSRFDKATQRRAAQGNVKAFVKSLKPQERPVVKSNSKPCLNCSVSEAVAALLVGVPDERLEATICQVVTELARVREARIHARLLPKPIVAGRKPQKTLAFATTGSAAD
jgi:hypothetical protein